MSTENSDDQEYVVDEAMTQEELKIVRRNNPRYRGTQGINPLHEEWNDTEVTLLSPLWDTNDPLSAEEIASIAQTHAVTQAQPGKAYEKDLYFLYAQYCLRRFSLGDGNRWKEAALALGRQFELTEIVAKAEQSSIALKIKAGFQDAA